MIRTLFMLSLMITSISLIEAPAIALPMSQSHESVSISGTNLQWLYIAKEAIREKDIRLVDYTVTLSEWDKYVVVTFLRARPEPNQMSGFEVKICKKNLAILGTYDLR